MAKKATTSIEGNVCTWEMADGTNVVGDLATFPEEIVKQLALHGLRQKGSDSYAGLKTVEEAAQAVGRVIEQLRSGEWTAARASGGGAPRTTLLAEALSRLAQASGKEVSIEQAAETISQLPDDSDEGISKKSLRADPAVKAMIATIKQERAAKELEENPSDVSALFG